MRDDKSGSENGDLPVVLGTTSRVEVGSGK